MCKVFEVIMWFALGIISGTALHYKSHSFVVLACVILSNFIGYIQAAWKFDPNSPNNNKKR